jgi:hypothetical protein
MFKDIKKWFTQKYIKFIVMRHSVSSQILFDYADGKWEQLCAGPGDQRTSNLVDVFTDQLVNHGKDQILIAIVHTRQDGGFVMGMSSDRAYCERWFLYGINEMAEVFIDVATWAKQENNYLIAKRKEQLNG